MPRFRFTVQGPDGESRSGEMAASDLDVARAKLAATGEVVELEELPAATRGALPTRDAEVVLASVAELSLSERPLADGLAAAAAEAPNGHVRSALEQLASCVEQGQSLEEALSQTTTKIPDTVSGLVTIACRTGRLGSALDELVRHQRSMRDLWYSLIAALLYPTLLLLIAALVFSFVPLLILPAFRTMFEEFELELPAITQALLRIGEAIQLAFGGVAKWFTFSAFAIAIASIVGIRVLIGGARWRRLAGTIPVFGPLFAWSGAASFTQLLAILIDHGLPLPEALRLTADGVSDLNVRESCRQLAVEVEGGRSLSQLLDESSRLPATLVPLVRWGEQNNNLADALRAANTLFVDRFHLRTLMVRSISPPVVFIFISLAVATTVIGLFLPLISLLQGLT